MYVTVAQQSGCAEVVHSDSNFITPDCLEWACKLVKCTQQYKIVWGNEAAQRELVRQLFENERKESRIFEQFGNGKFAFHILLHPCLQVESWGKHILRVVRFRVPILLLPLKCQNHWVPTPKVHNWD